MRILNVFADADGETHFREIEIECSDETPLGVRLCKPLPAKSIVFVEGTGTNAQGLARPHPAPSRQFVITLEGEVEVTTSDGESRVIGEGDVVLAEDTTGKGHVTKLLGEQLHRAIFVPID